MKRGVGVRTKMEMVKTKKPGVVFEKKYLKKKIEKKFFFTLEK